MHRYFIILNFFLLICVVLASDYNIEKIYEIPDFTQNNDTTELPAGGATFCAPVAVSNSLAWLDFRGYDRIMKTTGNSYKDQLALIRELASKDYMQTSKLSGTSPYSMLRGLYSFMYDRNYALKKFEAQSFRNVPKRVKLVSRNPELSYIKQSINGLGCVWLLIGWYTYDVEIDSYAKVGGHWVTVVGYGKDRSGKDAPDTIIVHDPSIRAGHGFSNQYVKIRKLESGRFIYKRGDKTYDDGPASGWLSCEGDMEIKDIAGAGLIQGIFVMEPEPISKPEEESD